MLDLLRDGPAGCREGGPAGGGAVVGSGLLGVQLGARPRPELAGGGSAAQQAGERRHPCAATRAAVGAGTGAEEVEFRRNSHRRADRAHMPIVGRDRLQGGLDAERSLAASTAVRPQSFADVLAGHGQHELGGLGTAAARARRAIHHARVAAAAAGGQAGRQQQPEARAAHRLHFFRRAAIKAAPAGARHAAGRLITGQVQGQFRIDLLFQFCVEKEG